MSIIFELYHLNTHYLKAYLYINYMQIYKILIILKNFLQKDFICSILIHKGEKNEKRTLFKNV